jgi:lipopolysaccharide export system protein LptC
MTQMTQPSIVRVTAGAGLVSDLEAGPSFMSARRVVRKSRFHDFFVTVLKLGLPLGALGLIIALFLWPELPKGTDEQAPPPLPTETPESTMGAPRYTGIDQQNRPYSITADSAEQPAGMSGVLDLLHPQGDLTLTDGTWLSLTSTTARYDQTQSKLRLDGDVELLHDKGYAFRSQEVQMDMKRDVTWSDQPVSVTGPDGSVNGQGFRMMDNGRVIIFTGRSKAVLSAAQNTAPAERQNGKKAP